MYKANYNNAFKIHWGHWVFIGRQISRECEVISAVMNMYTFVIYSLPNCLHLFSFEYIRILFPYIFGYWSFNAFCHVNISECMWTLHVVGHVHISECMWTLYVKHARMYHFFLRLFFQFVPLIPVLLCNCLYFCLLFSFSFIFTFFSLLFFCFVTYVCKSPNHGGNKYIYISVYDLLNLLFTCISGQ